jgi:hypothetical protein
MANSNFKVRTGLSIGENVSISDTGVCVGFTTLDTGNLEFTGNSIISTNTNGDIILQPNGVGDVDLVADTVVVGDANATATITTNGTGNLVLNTNAGTNAGSITLVNGTNGNITIEPNGVGNISTGRNYLRGPIRNSGTQGRGNIWELLAASTPSGQHQGISLDNSGDTARFGAAVLRTYSNVAGGRSRIILERGRFTGTPATTAPVLNGDFLGEVAVTGTSSNGWINDNVAVVPGFFGFTANENWSTNTNLGTNFSLTLAPNATTIASAANLISVLALNPQAAIHRADAFTFRQGRTGTADLMTIDVNGNVAITGDLRVNGNDIRSSDNTSQIVMSAAGATLELRGNNIQLENAAGSALTSAAVSYTRTYGEFAYIDPAGFAIAAQNTIYAMPLDTTLASSGTSISDTSRINIAVAGWYKIIISLQATLTVSNQPGQFDFWLRKNGADVANSKTQVDLLKDQKSVVSMDWLVNSDGDDYWEIVYVGTTANYADIDFPTIAATTTPYVSPVAPALLVNVIPAGM